MAIPRFDAHGAPMKTSASTTSSAFLESNFGCTREELFKIFETVPSNTVTYRLKNLRNEPIEGKFYEQELTRYTDSSDVYKVEKILAERRKNGKWQFLVCWYVCSPEFGSWVVAEAIPYACKASPSSVGAILAPAPAERHWQRAREKSAVVHAFFSYSRGPTASSKLVQTIPSKHSAPSASYTMATARPVRGFLVDITGVLYNSCSGTDGIVIEKSAEAVKMMYQQSRVKFVSNESSHTTVNVVARLGRLGIQVNEEDIITPAPVAVEYMKKEGFVPHVFVPSRSQIVL
ncbi:unnamed protein product [Caenorhabditis auriculariae]|uniref:Uncharacterized protein n=1 Tax=Caenorhabditis auriculariae TaxID=2777116 RepID=A0A8S1H856_9PELO|nr:unnamed protein product [Caenorhabditis auriculariae]